MSFAILFDDEYQKSMQTDVLNGDVFKKAFGIIAKKELGVDRMTKEMSNVCKEFSDKYNGQFKMPFNIIHFMQTKYKKSVYPKFIGFVASSGAVVTQNDDEQCYDIVVSGKAMCEQMRHILHYLAQFCRMNDQFRYYGINLVSNGTLTLRNEMQVAVSQVSRKIAKLEFLGNASYYVFQFVRHANVEELILHTDFNTEFTNREAFEYKLLQESKNKNIKVTYFV